MQRGEVWWADLPFPIGERPILLLSRNASSKRRSYVTVAQATSTVRGLRQEVRLTRADGMPQEYVVNLDDLQTINKAQLRKPCYSTERREDGFDPETPSSTLSHSDTKKRRRFRRLF